MTLLTAIPKPNKANDKNDTIIGDLEISILQGNIIIIIDIRLSSFSKDEK